MEHLRWPSRKSFQVMAGDAIDALQRNVREKRSLRPERGSCRKRSFGNGRQENFFRLQVVLDENRRPSAARLDSRQGLIKSLKKFLGHCPAKRRQMPRSGRLTSQNSVNCLLLEAPADDVMDGVDRDEGVLVFLEHDFLELVDLEARDDAVALPWPRPYSRPARAAA